MRKIIFYIVVYVPFVLGVSLFCFNVVNAFSSFCLFLGGYIAIKNTFDYRVVKKNRNYLNREIKCKRDNNQEFEPRRIKPRKRERVRIRKK